MAGGGVKVNNISITGGANGKTPTFKIENGHLFNSYNGGVDWYDLGEIEGPEGQSGATGVGISNVVIVENTFVITLTDGTTRTVPINTDDCIAVTEEELSTLIANAIDTTATATSGSTPSVSVAVLNNKAQFSFVLPKGDAGSDGAAGVGISNIAISGQNFVFTMTNGTTQTVALPIYDGTGD